MLFSQGTSEMLNSFELSVDEERINSQTETFKNRVISGVQKNDAIKFLVSVIDLTTLEGNETPDKISALCERAIHPICDKMDFPHTAAVCVFPKWVGVVKKCLKNSGVKTVSVAGSFPSGQVSLEAKLGDVQSVVDAGADEVDIVIDRRVFLKGDADYTFEEVRSIKAVCRDIPLKVIIETGELVSFEIIRKASLVSMLAGADFIKSSTGKMKPGATLPAVLVMLEAIKDFYQQTGKKVGIKPAGGIRTTQDALSYFMLVKEVLGQDWLTSERFRIGASSLLGDLTDEWKKESSSVPQKV